MPNYNPQNQTKPNNNNKKKKNPQNCLIFLRALIFNECGKMSPLTFIGNVREDVEFSFFPPSFIGEKEIKLLEKIKH